MKMKSFLCLMLILVSSVLTCGASPQAAGGNFQLVDRQQMEKILNEYLADQSDL